MVHYRGTTRRTRPPPVRIEPPPMIRQVQSVFEKSWRDENVLIVETDNWTPHLQTGLEVALRLAELGARVDYRFLGHELEWPLSYTHRKNLADSLRLKHRRPEAVAMELARGFAIGKNLDATFLYSANINLQDSGESPHFQSLELLREYEIDGCRLGLGIANSVVSMFRDSRPSLSQIQSLVPGLLRDCLKAKEWLDITLTQNNYTTLVVFNGRFSVPRTLADSGHKNGLSIMYHERGATQDRFWLEYFQTHDLERMRQRLLESYRAALLTDPHEAESVARSFFERRRSGDGIGWHSFTSYQQPGLLFKQFPDVRDVTLMTFFTTSDDEYEESGLAKTAGAWPDQFSALVEASRVARNLGARLAVRIHPNMVRKAPADRQRWRELLSKNEFDSVLVIDEQSPISSYELLDRSQVVFTVGSTIGAEAVYWGKKTVCFGDSLYSDPSLGIFTPGSRAELDNKLRNYLDSATDQSRILPFGYFNMTFGDRHIYYQPTSLWRGKLLGKDLYPYRRYVSVLKPFRSKMKLAPRCISNDPKVH